MIFCFCQLFFVFWLLKNESHKKLIFSQSQLFCKIFPAQHKFFYSFCIVTYFIVFLNCFKCIPYSRSELNHFAIFSPCMSGDSCFCELAYRDNLENQRSRNPTTPVGMARTCVYCYILGVECQGEDFTYMLNNRTRKIGEGE